MGRTQNRRGIERNAPQRKSDTSPERTEAPRVRKNVGTRHPLVRKQRGEQGSPSERYRSDWDLIYTPWGRTCRRIPPQSAPPPGAGASGFHDGQARGLPLRESMVATQATDRTPLPGPEGLAEYTDVPVERPSFRCVYKTHFDFVWSSARRLGVPAEAVEDVVQEIFIVVHGRLETVERPASLRSWLYGVVRRTVSTFHRARRTRAAREAPDATLDDRMSPFQPSPLDLAVLSGEVKLLWRLLEQMDATKREVFILAELEEMTMPEIAQAVGIPLNTAYSRLRAARHEFNEAVARHTAQQKQWGPHGQSEP